MHVYRFIIKGEKTEGKGFCVDAFLPEIPICGNQSRNFWFLAFQKGQDEDQQVATFDGNKNNFVGYISLRFRSLSVPSRMCDKCGASGKQNSICVWKLCNVMIVSADQGHAEHGQLDWEY